MPETAVLPGRAHEDLRGLFPRPEFLVAGYWSPARTDVMRWVLKPSQFIRPM
jgi:hypothetical protein